MQQQLSNFKAVFHRSSISTSSSPAFSLSKYPSLMNPCSKVAKFFPSSQFVRLIMNQISTQSLGSLLQSNFESTHQEVIDISGGCGSSYEVWIVSDKFEGKGLLARHRMVNAVLGTSILSSIHALVLVSCFVYYSSLENVHSH